MRKVIVLSLIIVTVGQLKAQSKDSKDNSTEWIPMQVNSGQLLIPVKINGHKASARLANAVKSNYVDEDFIDKSNIPEGLSGQSKKVTLTLQIGDLIVNQAIDAIPIRHANGNPSNLLLGDDIFKEFVVDIDFPHQRISFRRPSGFSPPKDVRTLAFKSHGESRAIPVSVEGDSSMLYCVYLGDPVPISVYEGYCTAHAMLKGRTTSIRMGGGQRTPPETIATVREVKFAGASFCQVPGVFPDDSVTGDHPPEIVGHIGLGILSRCRVIFDYSFDRLYVIPGSDSVIKAPFPKDRSGLVMYKVQDSYIVRFACPGSPAMRAGFHPGDTVTQINNQPVSSFMGTAWQLAAWSSVRLTDLGVTYSFRMKDSTVLKLTAADFF